MLRDMRVDFVRVPVCVRVIKKRRVETQRRSRDRVGPAPALSPSIMVTVMWLWAVLVLCHYIHNACCLPQHTLSITLVCTLPRAYLHMHNLDVLANAKKTKGAWIKAAATDSSEIAAIYCALWPTAAVSLWSFWPACASLQPPSCWMSWTGRRL